jgi:hypothetical protein
MAKSTVQNPSYTANIPAASAQYRITRPRSCVTTAKTTKITIARMYCNDLFSGVGAPSPSPIAKNQRPPAHNKYQRA